MKFHLKIFLLLLIIFSITSQAQNKSDIWKRQAQILINEGRFAEAVDQLNKYITANPHLADGYHTRGLCYEKMIQYQYSVLDLRRAVRLDPKNQVIRKDLNRVISTWHELLYKRIDGLKRDLAVDPKRAFTYLEIGKCYRWLEEWSDAEYWYDEYLKRDDNASPDEIIRYTEILAKTGSIIKGERILKKFVGRYPDDWRLWSRYGYFTLWLGKNTIALDAFTTALGFKPYFKEAEDGLDLAKRQGYVTLFQGRAFERVEYPIDRYFRLLNKNPDDDELRFKLVNELIGANRYEEAYQQLQYLTPKHSEDDNYKSLWNTVTAYRDSTFNRDVLLYTGKIKENPSDKESVMKLAAAYANLYYYDNATEVLNEYLQDQPDDKDQDARFMYAKYLAYNYEWEKAIRQINILLKLDPENIDYKLLRGQIGAWTSQDTNLAKSDLLSVIEARPNDVPCLLALVTVYTWEKDFTEAKKYLDIAVQLAPQNPDVQTAQSNYQLHLSAYAELQVFALRSEAGKLAEQGKCAEAFNKYEEYKSKRTALNNDELREYAEVASCAKHYDVAIHAYDKILAGGFDYKIALQRAKNYYYNKDTAKAVQELKNLSKMKPDDDVAQLFLADAYSMTDEPAKADIIYHDLLKKNDDEKKKDELYQRLVYNGEAYIKNKDFVKANSILNEVSSSTTNPDILKELMQRRLYLANALTQNNKPDDARELLEKYQRNISDFGFQKELNDSRLSLGDSYVLQERYGRAEDMYNDILRSTVDTSETRIVKQRIGWLPPYGFRRGLTSIGSVLSYFLPTNIGVSPFSSYYRDNQDLKRYDYGLRADAGFIGFLAIGALWSRITINNSFANMDLTQLKGIATIFFSKYLSLAGSYGILRPLGESDRKIYDGIFKYERPEELLFQLSYENNDARVFFYSPQLLYNRFSTDMIRFASYYDYKNLIRFSGSYNYYRISDGNEGNDLQLRFGKRFFDYGMIGYEYYFLNYAFITPIYYSPKNFESHSLWAEWKWFPDKHLKVKVGGKLGYVPAVDFIISEIYGEATYNLFSSLSITGRVGYGNSFRYDSSYKSLSASVYAYWGVF